MFSLTDVVECEGQLCSSHGSCMDNVNSYSCNCDPGYTGTDCETGMQSFCTVFHKICCYSDLRGCSILIALYL